MLIAQTRKALPRLYAVASHDVLEATLVLLQTRTIGHGVPKMQHAGGEPAVLASDARVNETHHKVGILQTPTGVSAIETVDAIQIRACDRKIAGLRIPPGSCRTIYAILPEAETVPATDD